MTRSLGVTRRPTISVRTAASEVIPGHVIIRGRLHLWGCKPSGMRHTALWLPLLAFKHVHDDNSKKMEMHLFAASVLYISLTPNLTRRLDTLDGLSRWEVFAESPSLAVQG